MMTPDDPNKPSPPRSRPPEVARPRLKVSDLLAGGREAILEHDGQDYRLRITANGKLILTK
jgi:hemin uptake protein HemP